MTNDQIWHAMMAVSNNSALTRDVCRSIVEKLDEKEKQDLLRWINQLVKPRIK